LKAQFTCFQRDTEGAGDVFRLQSGGSISTCTRIQGHRRLFALRFGANYKPSNDLSPARQDKKQVIGTASRFLLTVDCDYDQNTRRVKKCGCAASAGVWLALFSQTF
jgi:hypothetical protein